MATYYLVPGGNGNWNSSTNWSASSGGAPGAGVPVGGAGGDTAIFDANSMNTNITVNVASSTKNLNVSNYTGTIFLDEILQISTGSLISTSNFTIQSLSTDINSTILGKYLILTTNSSNPVNHNLGNITFNTGILITTTISGQTNNMQLVSSFTIEGFLAFSNNVTALFGSNSVTIYLKGSLFDFTTSSNWTGNATIEFINTIPVVMSSNKTGGGHNFNLTFNGTGDITISGQLRYTTSVLLKVTRIQGNVVVSPGHILLCSYGIDFDTNIIEWRNLLIGKVGSWNFTLYSDFTLTEGIQINLPTGGGSSNFTTFRSDTAGQTRKFTLKGNVTQVIFQATSTADIDSSDGCTVWPFTTQNPLGTNWKRLVAPKSNIKINIG